MKISVTNTNDAPVAGNDSISVSEDSSVTTGNLLANDTDIDGDTLEVEAVTNPAHGAVKYNGDSTFTYTPDADYNGTDTFTYSVSDSKGGMSAATVNVNVESVNDGPTATNDSISTSEDNSVTTGNLLANDFDIDGDALEVEAVSSPDHGLVTYNGDGAFTYTPDADYVGNDSFTYSISDSRGGMSTATVNISVGGTNDVPILNADSYTAHEDGTFTTGNVLANDTDADGDTLTVADFSQPTHGTISYNGDGTFTYTPDADYNGTDSFSYTVDDGNGGTNTATVNLTVTGTNDGPVAGNDTVNTREDGTVTTGNVLANDTDTDGDVLTVGGYTQPTHGSVNYNDDGTFTYTPDANYNGTDTFSYTVNDGNGGTNVATVTVNVEAANDAPTIDDALRTSMEAGGSLNIDSSGILATFSDADGDTLTISDYTQADHGTVTHNSDGTFTYTPDEGFTGRDAFNVFVQDGHGGQTVNAVVVDVEAPDTITPSVTPAPTPAPVDVVEPEPTPAPVDVVEIEPTPAPVDVVEIEPTPAPVDVVEPEPTPAPVDVVEPEPTPAPVDVVEPEPTPAPVDVVEPELTPAPVDVVEIEPTPEPVDVVETEPVSDPVEVTETEPVNEPAATTPTEIPQPVSDNDPVEQPVADNDNITNDEPVVVAGPVPADGSSDNPVDTEGVDFDYRGEVEIGLPETISTDWIVDVPNIPNVDAQDVQEVAGSYMTTEDSLGELLERELDLPAEIANSSFEDIYSEVPLDDQPDASYNYDTPVVQDAEHEVLTAAAAPENSGIISEGRAYLAGLWGLLRNAAGVSSRVDERAEDNKEQR